MRRLSISLLVMVLIVGAMASSKAIESFDSLVQARSTIIDRGY